MRRRYLPLAAVLGVATALLPAIASSETSPTVTAENVGGAYGTEHRWSPMQVTLASAGTVTFSNPTTVEHGVEWVAGPATPSCSGVPVGNTPAASGTKWSGTCTFSQVGTYTFYCTVHGAAMSGTITVNSNGTTTVTPPTTITTTTTPTEPPVESPITVSSLRSRQHGGSVKGAVEISRASAGASLEIDLFAATTSLSRAKHPARVRVGRFVRSSVPAGRTAFVVPLSAKARRALRRHHRLALTVKIVLSPVYGETTVLTRSVTERP